MFLSKILTHLPRPSISLNNISRIAYEQCMPITQRLTQLNWSRLNSTNVTSTTESNKIPNTELLETLSKVHEDAAKDLSEQKVFAVVHIAGSQFKVAHNDVIMINKKIEAECGEIIKLEKVLSVGGRNFTLLGQPLLKRNLVNVEAQVVEKTRGEKKIAFKMKKRKGYKKWKGHRQDISILKISKIDIDTSQV